MHYLHLGPNRLLSFGLMYQCFDRAFLKGNVSIRHLLSKETQLMSWWRYDINYVGKWLGPFCLAIYTSEIAISQLSDGASIILLFEYLGLVLYLWEKIFWVCNIHWSICFQSGTDNVCTQRSKDLELFWVTFHYRI